MKKFISGFITALVLVVLVYFGYPFIKGFFGGSTPETGDSGNLKVEVFGNGTPLSGVEVDLGKLEPGKGPSGSFSAVKTDEQGIAFFENVQTGVYDIFWNDYFFPHEYQQPLSQQVEIMKGETAERKIELTPK